MTFFNGVIERLLPNACVASELSLFLLKSRGLNRCPPSRLGQNVKAKNLIRLPCKVEPELRKSTNNRTTQDIGDGCRFLFVVSSQGFDVRGLDASRISECRIDIAVQPGILETTVFFKEHDPVGWLGCSVSVANYGQPCISNGARFSSPMCS